MRHFHSILACLVASSAAGFAAAQPVTLDVFDSLDNWTVVPSDGVEANAQLVPGVDGSALRLSFNFERGAGYCIIRRELPFDLPANYRFTISVRGETPANNLEFKLIDESGDSVWWVNRRAFEFPTSWRKLSQKKRHFQFAWGPSGGAPLTRISVIEFAVAAAAGGKGYVDFDDLQFEARPEPQPATQPARVQFSSNAQADAVQHVELDEAGRFAWRSANADGHPWLHVDLRQFRELGGVRIDWDAGDYAVDYDVALSADGRTWETAAEVRGSGGGRDYVSLPDAEAGHMRIDVRKSSHDRGVAVHGLRIMDAAFGESPNRMFSEIASESPRGWFPKYFLDQQDSWTVVGVVGDDDEALISATGAVEVDKLAFRLEPFVYCDGRLLTWADVETEQSLADDYLPIPTVRWIADGLSLETTALATGPAGESELVVRYRLLNTGDHARTGSLFIAARPFQVLPPWQNLNVTGGVARVGSMVWDGRGLRVGDGKVVRPWCSPDGVGATTFASGDIVESLAAGRLPESNAVTDLANLASAAFRYDFDLPAGESTTVVFSVPFHDAAKSEPHAIGTRQQTQQAFTELLDRTRNVWTRELNCVEISLPPIADRIVNTFRSTQAYILINADGPSIQPGSRTYERSWIRDGAITSTALLYTGHVDRVRKFIDWYAPYQFDSGKVPCVVDRRGPDPVPEHDSTGELIYLLHKYYAFSHDRACLEENLPRIVAGVDYIESLRSQRMTPEYRDGPPEKRACYGLVPESISHEGYSAKPMHSYWDSFFTLRGLSDAAAIAAVLDRPELERRFAALRDDYRKALYDSMRLAMKLKGIDTIPGCVELGDFDATSTAIGVFPCGEYGRIPEPELTNTFEQYYQFFASRRGDAIEWRDYTPYEIRLISTFILLGQPQRAHELLDFFFKDQRPAGWNHWAEIVWRDPDAPRFIGDMPHTWVGSAYINAVRNMFVYEDERNESLVLAAGVPEAWLESPGVHVVGLPTAYGTISYDLSIEGDSLVLKLDGDGEAPPGGVLLKTPPGTRALSVEAAGDGSTALVDSGVLLKQFGGRVKVKLGR